MRIFGFKMRITLYIKIWNPKNKHYQYVLHLVPLLKFKGRLLYFMMNVRTYVMYDHNDACTTMAFY